MLPGIYSKELKTFVPTKTCTLIHSSFIQNYQNLETTEISFSWCTEISFNWCTVKQTVIYSDKLYSMLKQNELSHHEKTWRKLNCIFKGEDISLRRIYNCNYMTFWKCQKMLRHWNRSVVSRGIGRKINR